MIVYWRIFPIKGNKINKNKNEMRDIGEKVERWIRAPWVRCRERYTRLTSELIHINCMIGFTAMHLVCQFSFENC
nr:MAG TPA: hypothetical protein [Caudoviricetes sp.]